MTLVRWWRPARLTRCGVAADAPTQLGELLRELADAVVLPELALFDGAGMVPVLLPRLRVHPPRLHGIPRADGDVHIRPRRRDRQQADPLQRARVTYESAIAPPIAEVRLRALAEYPLGHVVDGRQKAVPECSLFDVPNRAESPIAARRFPPNRQ